MVKAQINLQDSFLNKVRKENIGVTVYLINGFQLNGTVQGFDNFTVILETQEEQQQLLYKHAISTITPDEHLGNLFKVKSSETRED